MIHTWPVIMAPIYDWPRIPANPIVLLWLIDENAIQDDMREIQYDVNYYSMWHTS